jgi:hypothetical protein
VTGLSKAELNALVEEAIVDCYDEDEQLTGFANMVDNDLEVPFKTMVLGIVVTVTGITHTSHGLVADCVRGRHKQAIHVLDLPMPSRPRKVPSGSQHTGTGHDRRRARMSEYQDYKFLAHCERGPSRRSSAGRLPRPRSLSGNGKCSVIRPVRGRGMT